MTKYLWPTTRGWVICLNGVAWMLVAMVNHTLFALLLAWACIALAITSLISALLSLRGFNVTRATSGNAAAGQMTSMPLRIENTKWRRRQAVVVQEKIPFSLEINARHVLPPMGKKETRIFDRQVLAIKRGDFKLNDIILRSGDPAGLFCRERRFRLPASLIVYPPVEQLPDLLLHQHEAFQTTTGNPISTAGTSQDFFGVREYTPNDGMRHIHWRSSARQRKLMVKEFERNAVMSVAVLLDAHEQMVSEGTWSNLEYMIRVAASLCAYCSDLYCTFSFVSGGFKPVTVTPRLASECRAEVMYHLATLRPGNVRLASLVDDITRTLPKNTVVFCLSLNNDNAKLQTALDCLVGMGMDVRWYCASRKAFDKDKKTDSGAKSRHRETPGSVKAIQITPGMSMQQALCKW